jgi:hypothetical protein
MDNGKRKIGLKATLKDLDKEDLIEIIVEMTKINAKNKVFLDVFLKGSDEINIEALVEEAKKKIYRYIFGSSVYVRNYLKLREAKQVITDSSKILKEYPRHIADLKLYYVETCNEFTNEFGDISEQFYNSVVRTFQNLCIFIKKNPSLYDIFKARLDELYNNSRDFGWGYSDDIEGLYYGLKLEFEKEQMTIKLIIDNG